MDKNCINNISKECKEDCLKKQGLIPPDSINWEV